MSENKFKEIYETPTLYGFFFDVEEQYQQDMAVSYTHLIL